MKTLTKYLKVPAVLAAAVLGTSISVNAAPVLYGLTGSGGAASSLYTIDPITGATTLVGATGFTHLTGLDYDATSGSLYAVRSDLFNTGITGLLSLDIVTGIGTTIGATGAQIPDITIGPDGVIRGWTEGGVGVDDPIVIDKITGVATATSSGQGSARTGVATQDATHIYMKSSGSFYSVDVTTGVATLLFSTTTTMNNILENMPTGDLITGVRTGGGTQFYGIDTGTGAETALGYSTGVMFSAVAYVDDMTTVPVPATVALLGLGLAGLGWSRRKV